MQQAGIDPDEPPTSFMVITRRKPSAITFLGDFNRLPAKTTRLLPRCALPVVHTMSLGQLRGPT